LRWNAVNQHVAIGERVGCINGWIALDCPASAAGIGASSIGAASIGAASIGTSSIRAPGPSNRGRPAGTVTAGARSAAGTSVAFGSGDAVIATSRDEK